MSVAGKLREAQEANAALNEKVAEIEKARDAALERAQVKDAELDKLRSELESAQQSVQQHAEALQAAEAAIADANAECDQERKRAESAEKKLENPAFEHASEGADKVPDAESEGKTQEQFLAEYKAEKDPARRAIMWREFTDQQ